MNTKLKELEVPDFQSYEEEAEFWDQLDTADYMPDDDQWLHFDTPNQRALRVAILPGIVQKLHEQARVRGVSLETLVNVLLLESTQESNSPVPATN